MTRRYTGLDWSRKASIHGSPISKIRLQKGLKRQSSLTHVFAHLPGLRFGVDLHQDGGRADQQDHQISNGEVHEEDVGGVTHVLRFENDAGDHDVPEDPDAEDDGAEHLWRMGRRLALEFCKVVNPNNFKIEIKHAHTKIRYL